MQPEEIRRGLRRIRTKLSRLRTHDPMLQHFGTTSHGYRLNPPLPTERLEALERRYEIRLPEEYRQFLLHLGDGGAGPAYGVLPLEQGLDMEMAKALWMPFVPPTSRAEARGCNGCEEGYEQGLLILGDIGCGLLNYLVITGPEAGNIWHGWGCLPLPATPRGGGMAEQFHAINFSLKSSSAQYDRWVDAMLAPTNHERLTFLPWYEEDLDWKIQSLLGR
jgi:hypothetical protein